MSEKCLKDLKEEAKLRLENRHLIKKYMYVENIEEDNTLFDYHLVKDSGVDFKKIAAFKNNIPLYSIHDCYAARATDMGLIKTSVTSAFSDMYFPKPYIQTLHLSLLKQILSSDAIFGYPIEFIIEESSSKDTKDKIIIKEFKKVKIELDKIVQIKLNYLEDPKNNKDIFNNKYYLFTLENKNKKFNSSIST